MSLEQILDEIRAAHARGQDVARLHSGDLSVWSALAEQLRPTLKAEGIPYTITPGVPSFAAAAATRLRADLARRQPDGGADPRPQARTPVPERERLEVLAATGATLAIHLSIHVLEPVVQTLLPHYGTDCTAVVWRASWPDERIVRAPLGELAQAALQGGLERTALILVGRNLAQDGFGRSPPVCAGLRAPLPPGRVRGGLRMSARWHLSLIGMGMGSPAHLTRQGEQALRRLDLLLLPDKGEDKAELAAARGCACCRRCARISTPTRAAACAWHATPCRRATAPMPPTRRATSMACGAGTTRWPAPGRKRCANNCRTAGERAC